MKLTTTSVQTRRSRTRGLRLAAAGLAALALAVTGAAAAGRAGPGKTADGAANLGQDPVLIIDHVTVLPMTGEDGPLVDMTVVIRGGRIAQLGKSGQMAVPAQARRIDGTGKFLLPGLADMHVHPENDRALRLLSGRKDLPAGLFQTEDVYLPYIANGVTQILNMEAMSEAVGQREEVEGGRALGPHMGLAALIDGEPSAWPAGLSHPVATPADGRQAVRDMSADGFDYIKTYSKLDLGTFIAVVDEARRLKMKTLGHIPGRTLGITEQFFVPNFTMVAHAEELAFRGVPGAPGALCSKTGTGCTSSDEDIPRFVQMAKQNDTWLESTLTLDDRILQEMTDPAWIAKRPEVKYLNPYTRFTWTFQNPYANATPERIARQQRVVALCNRIVKAFADAGIPVLAGTDTGVPGVAAGFALQDELQALAKAGLTNQQILINDTRLAAQWLGVNADRGTVEANKRADLLLLNADPLKDIANTRKIAAVIVGGRYYSRAELDRRMNVLVAKYTAMPLDAALAAGAKGGGHWDEEP